jgi:hypothetical protein
LFAKKDIRERVPGAKTAAPLNAIMLRVILLNAIMLNVFVPLELGSNRKGWTFSTQTWLGYMEI